MLDFGYYLMDCMDGMREFPDKYFDLAVVDPPYGDAGGGGFSCKSRFDGGTLFRKYVNPAGSEQHDIKWDCAPGDDYFQELFRVSKNQIIWGGNYFSLPPNRCFLVWRKTNIVENFSMSMAEYAWCSFNENAKVFDCSSQTPGRLHPTQKPIELYAWIFKNYTKPGDKILDTHVGSASSLIAAHDAGLNYVGFEIDEYYYEKSKQRLDEYEAQMNIFDFGVERINDNDEQ